MALYGLKVSPLLWYKELINTLAKFRFKPIPGINCLGVTDSLSTMLRLLGEELEEASWLIQVRSRMDPVEPYNKKW